MSTCEHWRPRSDCPFCKARDLKAEVERLREALRKIGRVAPPSSVIVQAVEAALNERPEP